jgi:carbon-monoxide dehydrogenase medium subunit
VIPAAFTYLCPSSIEEAIALLAADEDAKILAGGHSLLPIMKLRLAAPSALIDLGRIDGLAYVREEDGVIAVGALTRHHDVATSPLLGERAPLLAETAGHVGDPQVRHRGTIGGSIVHGDPASDLPAAVLALDATIVLIGPNGRRELPASEFFLGFLETAIAPDVHAASSRLGNRRSGRTAAGRCRRGCLGQHVPVDDPCRSDRGGDQGGLRSRCRGTCR